MPNSSLLPTAVSLEAFTLKIDVPVLSRSNKSVFGLNTQDQPSGQGCTFTGSISNLNSEAQVCLFFTVTVYVAVSPLPASCVIGIASISGADFSQ